MFKFKILEYNNYNTLILIGPLATKKINIKKNEAIFFKNGVFFVPSNHTLQSLLNNLKNSITEGYSNYLTLVGVGYKWEILENNLLKIYIGFTNDVLIKIPSHLKVELINPTVIKFSGSSKFYVTQFISQIRDIKAGYKDSYKKKGIHIGLNPL